MARRHTIKQELKEIKKAERADVRRDELILQNQLIINGNLIRLGRMVEELGDAIMSELEDAQAATAKVQADVENVRRVVSESRTAIQGLQQQVADLQAQIDAGGDATALKAGLADIATTLTDVDAQLDIEAPDVSGAPA